MSERGKKVLILGIGNSMKGDDGFGPMLARRLKVYESSEVKIMEVGEVPENYLSQIIDFSPEVIIILDSVYIKNKKPQDIVILDQIEDNISISTHTQSLKLFLDLLKLYGLKFKTFVLGIIPEKINIGEDLSEKVRFKIEEIVQKFPQYLKNFTT